ncbi:hypothetical protein FHETE_8958 [Fusarium heterosporum]|uniref:Uncharacterized protein n=1 Tax=Fusarium heterosporum TaxID=42747 RepID=A0A8H5SWN7_FUSHE|nr:hypothetical protein FHETE_8958 [Fusarium heterosporum]
MGVGRPRLDAYERIISRLFENLALFHILKRTDGPHVFTAEVPTDVQGIRRRFLNGLSLMCDNRKGGDSTTSMALEARDEGDTILWIAANLTPKDSVIVFLEEVLDDLRNEPKETEADRKTLSDELARKCIRFAAPRLKKESALLSRAASYCEKHLKTYATTLEAAEMNALLGWLPQFSAAQTDPLTLCQTAYNARHDPQMKTLLTLSHELSVAPRETAGNFRTVRHFVGRLAERIRVPMNLVHDSLQLGPLLDSCTTRRVEAPAVAVVPPADGLRNLKSILRRMLPNGDPRLEGMQQYLYQLDGPMQLELAIKSMYDEDQGKTCVHAEIQMLEEFHRNNRRFVDQDRYIACSKPACLCCRFYFRYHPGRFVEPASHQKTYLNWRPVELSGGQANEHWMHQRYVLANISVDLRKAVVENLMTQQQPSPWQPDSLTNITADMEAVSLADVQEEVESEDDWSDDTASLTYVNGDGFGDEMTDSGDESEGGAHLDD